MLLGLLILAASPAQAGSIESLASIAETARQFVEQQSAEFATPPRISVGRLDRRLRLPACSEPLQAYLPPGGRLLGNTTVGVRCTGTSPWSLYAPVSVQVFERVLVAARPLPRGTQVTAEDVRFEERDLAQLTSGYLADEQAVVGMVVKRPVRAGTAFNSHLLQLPRVVRRGERVTILARSGALEVRMEGKAMADAAKGQRLRVRNISSGRQIEATAVAPGLVRVGL